VCGDRCRPVRSLPIRKNRSWSSAERVDLSSDECDCGRIPDACRAFIHGDRIGAAIRNASRVEHPSSDRERISERACRSNPSPSRASATDPAAGATSSDCGEAMLGTPVSVKATRRFILAAFVLGTLPRASVALADEKYETLFKEGRAKMDARDYNAACELFKESLDLGAPVGALLNLAECEDKRGHLARSLSLWRDGLAKLPPSDPRRDIAARQIDDVDHRVGKVAVVWPGAPADARSFVDGSAVTLGGTPVPVDPGAHKVTVTSTQGSRTIDVSVTNGELKSVDLSVPAGGSKTAPVEHSSSPGLLIGSATSFGIAGLALVGAAISGAVYFSAKSTIDTECPDRNNCQNSDAIAASSRGRAAGAANIAMFVIAGVGAGAGVTLLALHLTKSSRTSASSPEIHWMGSSASLVMRF
jgi:hypothetical protein